jgi:hypothetical protein
MAKEIVGRSLLSLPSLLYEVLKNEQEAVAAAAEAGAGGDAAVACGRSEGTGDSRAGTAAESPRVAAGMAGPPPALGLGLGNEAATASSAQRDTPRYATGLYQNCKAGRDAWQLGGNLGGKSRSRTGAQTRHQAVSGTLGAAICGKIGLLGSSGDADDLPLLPTRGTDTVRRRECHSRQQRLIFATSRIVTNYLRWPNRC